jgi:hypothetical protein
MVRAQKFGISEGRVSVMDIALGRPMFGARRVRVVGGEGFSDVGGARTSTQNEGLSGCLLLLEIALSLCVDTDYGLDGMGGRLSQ